MIVKPWNCLSEASSEKTTVLYFDSLPERLPLASSRLIARVVIELDAIRAQMPANESVNVGFANEVKHRIAFIRVKASQLLNASVCVRMPMPVLCRYSNRKWEASTVAFILSTTYVFFLKNGW